MLDPVLVRAARADVADALASLADTAHQTRAWVDRDVPPDVVDELAVCVASLYDDTSTLPDAAASVGTVLYAGDEVTALDALDAVLGPLIDRLRGAPDVAYLAAPEWPAVVRRAGVALAAMVRNGWVDHPPPEPAPSSGVPTSLPEGGEVGFLRAFHVEVLTGSSSARSRPRSSPSGSRSSSCTCRRSSSRRWTSRG